MIGLCNPLTLFGLELHNRFHLIYAFTLILSTLHRRYNRSTLYQKGFCQGSVWSSIIVGYCTAAEVTEEVENDVCKGNTIMKPIPITTNGVLVVIKKQLTFSSSFYIQMLYKRRRRAKQASSPAREF